MSIDAIFLDWLCTIKGVCTMIFHLVFKMELTGCRIVTILAQMNFATVLVVYILRARRQNKEKNKI